jgi:hypothetical protein
MAVGISEVAGVHEAMVFYWIDVGGTAIAAAAPFIASTASRLSHDRASITSLDVFGGMGRLVKVRHLECARPSPSRRTS